VRRALACLLAAAALFGCAATPTEQPVSTTAPAGTASPAPSPISIPEPTPTAAETVEVTLYVPDADRTGLMAERAQAEDSPRGLLGALVDAGALPDVDFGRNITFSVGDEAVTIGGETADARVVRLDLSDAFGQAVVLAGAPDGDLMVQSLVNTFLTRYEADALILTIEGTVLQTMRRSYESAIVFDAYAETSDG